MYAALLTWTYALSDQTGFLLQRSTNSGSSWTTDYALASTASSYIDSNVSLTNTYWYRIAATNNYGTGTFSNTGSVFDPIAKTVVCHANVEATGSSGASGYNIDVNVNNGDIYYAHRYVDSPGFPPFPTGSIKVWKV